MVHSIANSVEDGLPFSLTATSRVDAVGLFTVGALGTFALLIPGLAEVLAPDVFANNPNARYGLLAGLIGVAIALLLELAGVDRAVIVEDYLRSAVFAVNLVRAGELEPGLMASFGFMPSPGQIDALIGVRADYLEAAWDEITRGWSDVPGYFAAAGVDGEMQGRIRDVLVD